ncbi:hypothetical protein [Burkholderia gladioli]|uniref:hypothetical protein n=1 Tax=Burkholderia gladioli TaxID=28095 RepID=UPI0016408C65|nr:hypothetical protein [Burkholderia gladioli]
MILHVNRRRDPYPEGVPTDIDERNKLLIEQSAFLTPDGRNDLLYNSTPEQRAAHMSHRKLAKVAAAMACSIVLAIVISAACRAPFLNDSHTPTSTGQAAAALPATPPAPAVQAIDDPLGRIDSIEIHTTMNDITSTIRTDEGDVFQVEGAVSASMNDKITIHRTTGAIVSTAVCVESKIKSACYRVL